ncbi:MAG: hypothetical protein QX189_20055 [Methylococcales bacterium]
MGLPLVTKAEYKAYMGISSTNEDAKIDSLIPKVSALVKSLCNNSFNDYVNDAAVEVFEGGTSYYVPLEGPVLSIMSVEISTDNGNTYTELVEFTDFAYSKATGLLRSIGRDFPILINGFKLTYTAGYEVIPADLKVAVLDLISYYMKNESAIHSNRAPGGNTVQIEYVLNTKLPAHISRILDLYSNTYN